MKLAIVAGRFNTSKDQAKLLMAEIHMDIAEILSIPETAVNSDTEFYGRNLDLVFSVNKQNTPK